MTDAIPGEDELLSEIAADARVEPERARQILHDFGISLRPPMPAQRHITIRRLYVAGVKSGTHNGTDGPFKKDVNLDPGTWVIASRDKNSAGKTSMLWALVFALRGESDEMYERSESFRWFDYIRVDAEVSGVAVSIRLQVQNGRSYSATLLTAESIDQLLALDGREDAGPGVRVVDRAVGPGPVADLVGRFMMERLGLRPLETFAASKGAPTEDDGERDGAVQPHAWPSYFPMIALSSASDSFLFGKTAVGQLPTRLMQVFLDVPFVADTMAADASEQVSKQNTRHAERRARQDARARVERFGDLDGQLRDARAHLSRLRRSVPDLEPLRAAARAAGTAVVQAERRLSQVRALHEQARRARIDDERRHREASETAAARALFAALSPHACPRCETAIDGDRKRRENAEQVCAVCTTPLHLPEANEEDRQEVLKRLREQAAASRAAERRTSEAVAKAETTLADARQHEQQANAALDAAMRDTDVQTQISAAEYEVARLAGAVQILDELGEPEPVEDDDAQRVLAVAAKILKRVASTATTDLFAELNSEIVTVARELGVANLDSVRLDLSGKLNARKSGEEGTTPFKKFSPGERVRLRIAIIISLMTVGRRHGINSHPGLLLIDSPADVEIIPGDVKIMLERLLALGRDTEGLQLILTTGHDAVWDVFPRSQLIVGANDKHLF
ncbi:hypothetical protein HC028_09205 [Planosporangium flavigriseum]|uniref:AAA domain-containing protein n=1 Tax=Planosporangium flavigriseum TaxID=373681 RepID=A0A8J3LK33_9ACTN|nr:hypothetical protein [Planosporangium flavigriseum]NJC64678.1 hypothetical protein [Planosporangium flavigriseum]GIG74097.1 hypothetical protein Pfl04_25010 [Planosporangium flavigriseum]